MMLKATEITAGSARSCCHKSAAPRAPIHLHTNNAKSASISITNGSSPIAARPGHQGCKVSAGKGFGVPVKKATTKVELEPGSPCPCGSGRTYEACCAPYHKGAAVAATPELLLRARYSAYALKNPEYIADTTHPDSDEWSGSRSVYLQSVRATQRRATYTELVIEGSEAGANADEMFMVFRLAFTDKERPNLGVIKRRERSQFVRVRKTGAWAYMNSEMFEDSK